MEWRTEARCRRQPATGCANPTDRGSAHGPVPDGDAQGLESDARRRSGRPGSIAIGHSREMDDITDPTAHDRRADGPGSRVIIVACLRNGMSVRHGPHDRPRLLPGDHHARSTAPSRYARVVRYVAIVDYSPCRASHSAGPHASISGPARSMSSISSVTSSQSFSCATAAYCASAARSR